MTKDIKRTIAFLFFLLAGIVLGTVIARLCEGVPVLSWLAYSMSVGLDRARRNMLKFALKMSVRGAADLEEKTNITIW